ncbi:CAMK/CAMK1 protein kinase [Aphanomyces invadans]|uniref:non-specific serine/threonine protein kinase n=1 Tax=Aphanomyces invadans TaxID=157072 RepID=A0A024U5Q4_9STRA|nr:CAMK/CAMK1 protein kinase [Aphanomyces invadans]ETW00903.1 CAMK/CAMK1 protein kinase [Aphanomyces invadans]|eukprot:XP_008869901.1 CAMK/CAMK1 protein kinase [Aphanomyces invadans]
MGCSFSLCPGPQAAKDDESILHDMSAKQSTPYVPVVAPVHVTATAALPCFRDKYVLGGTLGEGSYAIVKKARNKETGESYAVKVFKKEGLSEQDERDIQTEVAILGRLNHPNVLNLVDFFSEPKYYYIVTDLCEGGELFDRISQLSYYTEKEARDLVKVLLTAIDYCHDHGVVHRDLKPENILMINKTDNASIKIADFGFAKEALNGLTTTCGSPEYVAPEIISRSDASQTYGTPVDIWSIGVITYVLLGGYTPFHDENQNVLFDNICHGQFYFYSPDWDEISDDAKEFLKLALTVDPAKRPTAKQLLKDPWIVDENVSIYQLSSVQEKLPMLNTSRNKFKAAVNATVLVNRFRKVSTDEPKHASV